MANYYGTDARDIARELARRYSTMTHGELDLLESILVPTKYQKGDAILREGDVCTCIYWIAKGLIRMFYIKKGREMTEHLAAEGSTVLCIESYFQEKPSKLQIVALETTVVYTLPRPLLEQAAMKSLNIQMLYRKMLEESLIDSQRKADMLRFESAQSRYENFVKAHPELILRAPLVHIASYLQMTPETLSRVRNAITTSGQ